MCVLGVMGDWERGQIHCGAPAPPQQTLEDSGLGFPYLEKKKTEDAQLNLTLT